jgi:hypothetical protein
LAESTLSPAFRQKRRATPGGDHWEYRLVPVGQTGRGNAGNSFNLWFAASLMGESDEAGDQ